MTHVRSLVISAVIAVCATPALAQARTVSIRGGSSYAGSTTQDVAPKRGEYLAGLLGIHVDASRRVDGVKLTWLCRGQQYTRRIDTAGGDSTFGGAPVPIKKRWFTFTRKVDWYADTPGHNDHEGTAMLTVRGHFFTRTPKRPRKGSLPLPQSTDSIASGTFSVTDGSCKVRGKFEFDYHETQRQSLDLF